MQKILISTLMAGFLGLTAAADPNETRESESFIFEMQYGSKTVSIFSKEPRQLIAEYQTVEPVVALIAVSDISLVLRQLRSKYDHMVDVWVALESLQIVRARHETASEEAVTNAKKVISAGQDSILDDQNHLNLVNGKATSAIFSATPEAINASRIKGVKICEGILMGLFDNLSDGKP